MAIPRQHDEPSFHVYRLVGGPCDGDQAEAPEDATGDELWRYTGAGTMYARYARDDFARVYRFGGELRTRDQLVAMGDEHYGVVARVDQHTQHER